MTGRLKFVLGACLVALCLAAGACEDAVPQSGGDGSSGLDVQAILSRFDSDGDGISDAEDPFPYFVGIPIDRDSDGVPDRWDLWPDYAGVPPSANPVPPDYDNDGLPDASDPYPAGEDQVDTDGDGTVNSQDADPYGVVAQAVGRTIDSDGDYTPDWLDSTPYRNDFADYDGDGYSNRTDLHPEHDDDYDRDGHYDQSDIDPYDSDEW